MKILVTGGTGNVGGAVVKELLKRGAKVRVLARKQPEEGKLPAGVEVAIGDLLDPASVEQVALLDSWQLYYRLRPPRPRSRSRLRRLPRSCTFCKKD